LHAFATLEEIPKQQGPYFVFAHILTPHQPFLFNENGEYVTPKMDRYTEWYTMKDGRNRDEYVEGYRKQAMYIDKKIQEVIDKIISNSAIPPVIILQSDHGPDANLDPESAENSDLREKMGILNAYYFPDRDYADLYADITPVNTFRVVLNHFFGTDFQLLENRNYFIPWSRPYQFIDVTDKIQKR
jgi:membrane-anchored protein YejM (alkaline phosphatase superfamily)